jgi:hypothetical protein
MKSKLNYRQKFQRNWNVPLGCCWNDLDEQDLMEFYLVKIWIQNVGDIDFKMISTAENSK